MNESTSSRERPVPSDDDAYRLACALVALGEGKAAVDMMRRKLNSVRAAVAPGSPELFRVLSAYAGILESTDALAEAEFIRAEAVEIVESTRMTDRDAVEEFLKYGLLLCKMHNYDGAIARLKEAVRRAEALDGAEALTQEIILAQAWRSQAQAFEALGEFSEASNALDALMNVKRQIRFLIFSMAR
jgi:tetratricopeptide (TPR) repeat protein